MSNHPATNDDIRVWFGHLKIGAHSIIGENNNLEDAEKAQMRLLAESALNIIESVVIDINNIAFHFSEDHR